MLLRSKNLKNVPETNLKKSKLQFQVSAVFSQKKEYFSPLQENLLDIVQIKKKILYMVGQCQMGECSNMRRTCLYFVAISENSWRYRYNRNVK